MHVYIIPISIILLKCLLSIMEHIMIDFLNFAASCHLFMQLTYRGNHAHRAKVDNSADAPTLSTLFSMMSNATTAQLADVPDDFAAIRAP